MPIAAKGVIAIPDSAASSFDHGAFEPVTRFVFVAHTGRSRLEVIDHDRGRHLATLEGFPEAAGVVADAGSVLVTNRGSASLAWVDAQTLKTRAVFPTGARPNGVALVAARKLAVVACIGDEDNQPELQVVQLDSAQRWSKILPGRPRWCVTDSSGSRVFLAIREPSMIWSASLPALDDIRQWPLSSHGAHGLDIDHAGRRLYAACDDATLVEIEMGSGKSTRQWPLDGAPDAVFFNPASGLVHVAIGTPGLVQSIDPRSDAVQRTLTAPGAHTTALVPPDRLYVFSSHKSGAILLSE
jgi:DNA-binding beta-propeller fold protein YncE